LWPQLARIQASSGVDAATLLAIYGKETSYGAVTGSFDLLEALASLAYEGRRRAMFETEVLATLKLIDSGVPRATLRGSYAGATGYPQFMPSVVLRLRADGDGDGYADIWRNEADALASIANYLKDAGWKSNLRWGAPAQLPASLDRNSIRSQEVDPKCPAVFRRLSRWQKISDWRAVGVTTAVILPDQELAALLEPSGPGETPYLLTSNYRAILQYNCSNFYAMSVATLSDRIARR
jgi:lytic murein transglycosylase